MKIWKYVRENISNLPWKRGDNENLNRLPPEEQKGQAPTISEEEADDNPGQQHLELAKESLRDLLNDDRIPPEARTTLADDYSQIQAMLEKLEHGHIHIAVFGRVSVGKSALLNALLGQSRFNTSPLHGETKVAQWESWEEVQAGGVYLIDTPGINEISGEERERIAHEVAGRSDLVLFAVDGDATETELSALRILAKENRPMVLVLNKIDRMSKQDRELILDNLEKKVAGLVAPENITTAAAMPSERIYIQLDEQGNESEIVRSPAPDVQELRETLWHILEKEGMTLSALNVSLFAGKLSDQVSKRIIEIRRELATKVVRSYCIAKGVAVAVNPIPVADLLAASAVDAGMIVHLGKIYGIPMTRREAGSLMRTIAAQMALLMSTVWAVQLVSSVLKGGSLGLSTLVTAGAQGAVGYYSTYIVGQAAERYFVHGKSWGETGPKQVVKRILDQIDRDSILEQAREDIFRRLRTTG